LAALIWTHSHAFDEKLPVACFHEHHALTVALAHRLFSYIPSFDECASCPFLNEHNAPSIALARVFLFFTVPLSMKVPFHERHALTMLV
jgi:hypothetical protein